MMPMMDAYVKDLELSSFCATCLSYGRKMYPVIMTKPYDMFIRDFKLTPKDRVCWECYFFILKMTAFRYRALRAQSCLKALLSREPTPLRSLSTLSKSKGVYLNITELPQVEIELDPLFDGIKSEKPDCDDDNAKADEYGNETLLNVTETPHEELKHEPLFEDIEPENPECGNEDDANESVNETNLNITETPQKELKPELLFGDIEPENPECGNEDNADEYGDEMIRFEVFRHKTSLPGDAERNVLHGETSGGESLANASLLTLLNKKSPLFPLPTEIPAFKIPIPVLKRDIEQQEALDKGGILLRLLNRESQPLPSNTKVTSEPVLEKEMAVHQPEPVIITEERLSEEEFKKWWEEKRQLDYYVKSIPVYRCDKCIEPFWMRRSFLAHERMHTEMFGELSCSVCQLRFSSEETLAAHKEQHYRLLKCGRCGHKWDNPNSMREHCTDHGVPVTVWTCEICLREFTENKRLLNHMKSHAYQKCPECNKKIACRGLKIHMLIHKRGVEKPFACEECGRRFCSLSYLKRHMLRHSNEIDKQAYCLECNKQFRDRHIFKMHMKYKHQSKDDHRYKCEECGKTFPVLSHLRQHALGHSEQRNFACDSCPARFKTPQSVNRHRQVKHKGVVLPRKLICDYCGRGFQTKTLLSHHINGHTGARPYACGLCGATFGHASARYLHRRLKHKIPKKTKDK